jgi:hypothetical protein
MITTPIPQHGHDHVVTPPPLPQAPPASLDRDYPNAVRRVVGPEWPDQRYGSVPTTTALTFDATVGGEHFKSIEEKNLTEVGAVTEKLLLWAMIGRAANIGKWVSKLKATVVATVKRLLGFHLAGYAIATVAYGVPWAYRSGKAIRECWDDLTEPLSRWNQSPDAIRLGVFVDLVATQVSVEHTAPRGEVRDYPLNSASAPSLRSSISSLRPSSSRRPEMTTRAPSCAKAIAVARPMPAKAPVMRTTGWA